MDILEATAEFERWLGQQLEVVRSDLALKHENVAKAPFPFFRATFYRWVQRWPDICGDLANAPSVLAVGDLHIENFGTWRDAEGSLIWGVNDLDEVYPSAYSLDLVRLTASAYLAMEEGHLAITRKEASDALERGYREAIEAGGRPFALVEHHRWLRLLAFGKLRDPARFCKKIKELSQHLTKSSVKVQAMLEAALPQPGMKYELKKRIARLGSLGHMRVLALASWQGAYVVREAKALRPSAWVWARRRPTNTLYCGALASRAVRVADPHVHFRDGWLVRRLAPRSPSWRAYPRPAVPRLAVRSVDFPLSSTICLLVMLTGTAEMSRASAPAVSSTTTAFPPRHRPQEPASGAMSGPVPRKRRVLEVQV